MTSQDVAGVGNVFGQSVFVYDAAAKLLEYRRGDPWFQN